MTLPFAAPPPIAPGLILSAPASGSGKTVLTLAILRALRQRGVAVAGIKTGPDYIDPAFHAAASGRPCVNLDSWAMAPSLLRGLARAQGTGADLLLAEGVMGLFDGALGLPAGCDTADGSTAALARLLGWPVVLIVDVKGMATSVAALIAGFVRHRPDVAVRGVILNRVGSARHVAAMTAAIASELPELCILGGLPRQGDLALPERHLGLVQAREHPDLERFLDASARLLTEHIDLDRLIALAQPLKNGPTDAAPRPLPPPGQRIALARDDAFAFTYPAVLQGWRDAGAEITFFSPLADEGPDATADAIHLPGGYPELHAGRLAAGRTFLPSLRAAAGRGVAIFGECGGYMVLGRGLTAADGTLHAMAGLLPVDTSFAARRRHLGYRRARQLSAGWPGAVGEGFSAHEFHYASIIAEAGDEAGRLFAVTDAGGTALGSVGQRRGSVAGSFLHLISAAPGPA
ncbi:cobyrinic acid a,c-diamide synthase [Rhodospirillum rubrum F11]|uniref:Cobyrinate a,c-diamide synthase n=3 Tax=Rhodospirillum rubrum TaxID=1085 RepID=Q2RNZ2_RHORT|nr:cobyrinate a,c-diamide synthase [Rhodospirillum rubrum]ABC24153.1 cobyrinate a,c-diamide synthase / hydrogenobyrinic acid a,c-diamide synthase (glutamine-hydrolysing) [Rhodospirillum rubrum ATCC 11170]AEO49904.1 cobyrinic acid a,c-diamide synthase [Rhodospirillum rubrum F11]QXG80093.1 cobyrinate a,c-diamide synthase [Rhodospirillum rubrum]